MRSYQQCCETVLIPPTVDEKLPLGRVKRTNCPSPAAEAYLGLPAATPVAYWMTTSLAKITWLTEISGVFKEVTEPCLCHTHSSCVGLFILFFLFFS